MTDQERIVELERRLAELREAYECNTAIMHARTKEMEKQTAKVAELERKGSEICMEWSEKVNALEADLQAIDFHLDEHGTENLALLHEHKGSVRRAAILAFQRVRSQHADDVREVTDKLSAERVRVAELEREQDAAGEVIRLANVHLQRATERMQNAESRLAEVAAEAMAQIDANGEIHGNLARRLDEEKKAHAKAERERVRLDEIARGLAARITTLESRLAEVTRERDCYWLNHADRQAALSPARYQGRICCRCDFPGCVNERRVAERFCSVHANVDPTRDFAPPAAGGGEALRRALLEIEGWRACFWVDAWRARDQETGSGKAYRRWVRALDRRKRYRKARAALAPSPAKEDK
jgi:hypothetical protein